MKGDMIVLDHLGERQVAARLSNGRVDDVLTEPTDGDMPLPGAIYRAIVDRQFKGQGGVMLRLPNGNAFLRQSKGLSPGQPVLVQVTGYAEDGKAVPVTQKILFKSRYAIVTPDAPGLNVSRAIRDEEVRIALMALATEGMEDSAFGLILRTTAEGAPEDEVFEDITDMRAAAEAVLGDADGDTPEMLLEGPLPHVLAWRDWPEAEVVHTTAGGLETLDVLGQLEVLCDDYVSLSGGASMYIEPTRALVAVDVNTGGDTSPAAGLKANLAAIRELPRQLRCRGLGGQVVLDLAPLSKKDRKQVEHTLRSAFRTDPIETALVGWTPLGHFELQRKRERLPLTKRDLA
ncbi:MAG: ribonuclease E/G [Pseudoruegeria sp.]